MTMNLVVPVGQVRFVFCRLDEAGTDEYRVEEIGLDRYARITVPAGIWFGFQGRSSQQSLVLNIASIPHDPLEAERLNIADLNYIWNEL
jgi:dTDP-4-dehydrorhamnose 3,5-epimerase